MRKNEDYVKKVSWGKEHGYDVVEVECGARVVVQIINSSKGWNDAMVVGDVMKMVLMDTIQVIVFDRGDLNGVVFMDYITSIRVAFRKRGER